VLAAIDAGSPRATDRRKASLTGKTTVLQWGGGRSGLGRPGFDVRAFKRTTRPAGDEAPDTSSRLAVLSREHSVQRLETAGRSGLGVIEASGSVATPALAGKKRRWLPGAWVLVFDNVGCISRPDASGSPLEAVQSERVMAGEPARGEPRHFRQQVSRSETSNRRAKLFTSREQPGGRNRATKERFAGFRARLKALRVEREQRPLIGRVTTILGQAGQAVRRRSLPSSCTVSGRWLWSHTAVPGR